MKIPKKYDKLLDRRQKLAEQLNSVEVELDRWLESKGADMTDPDICDCVLSGCCIYCEPSVANLNVRDYIENKL